MDNLHFGKVLLRTHATSPLRNETTITMFLEDVGVEILRMVEEGAEVKVDVEEAEADNRTRVDILPLASF